MTEFYKAPRMIDGKYKYVVIDDNRKIVNRYPTKEELKKLGNEPYYKKVNRPKEYPNEEMLNCLIQFYEENERPPSQNDFSNNPEYPSYITYRSRFGSWSNALKLVGLDADSMVRKGFVETNHQKARLSELKVIDHFKNEPIDLAGENCLSPCDGICPNGKTYDVKSSKLYRGEYYDFSIRNKYREEIEIYYFLAFNEDYTILEHTWRVPGETVDEDRFYIAKHIIKIYNSKSRDIGSMKKYDITDRIKEIINEKVK